MSTGLPHQHLERWVQCCKCVSRIPLVGKENPAIENPSSEHCPLLPSSQLRNNEIDSEYYEYFDYTRSVQAHEHKYRETEKERYVVEIIWGWN